MPEIPSNDPSKKLQGTRNKEHSDELYMSLANNFDEGNYEEVKLRGADIAFSFKRFNLDGIVNPPSGVGPVPRQLYLRTHSGNIYGLYSVHSFIQKAFSFYELPETEQEKILNADMVIVNSRKGEIYPLSTNSSDKAISIGEQFKFGSDASNVVGNTTTITKIIGDTGSMGYREGVKENSIKDEYAENLKRTNAVTETYHHYPEMNVIPKPIQGDLDFLNSDLDGNPIE